MGILINQSYSVMSQIAPTTYARGALARPTGIQVFTSRTLRARVVAPVAGAGGSGLLGERGPRPVRVIGVGVHERLPGRCQLLAVAAPGREELDEDLRFVAGRGDGVRVVGSAVGARGGFSRVAGGVVVAASAWGRVCLARARPAYRAY